MNGESLARTLGAGDDDSCGLFVQGSQDWFVLQTIVQVYLGWKGLGIWVGVIKELVTPKRAGVWILRLLSGFQQ